MSQYFKKKTETQDGKSTILANPLQLQTSFIDQKERVSRNYFLGRCHAVDSIELFSHAQKVKSWKWPTSLQLQRMPMKWKRTYISDRLCKTPTLQGQESILTVEWYPSLQLVMITPQWPGKNSHSPLFQICRWQFAAHQPINHKHKRIKVFDINKSKTRQQRMCLLVLYRYLIHADLNR